MLKRVNSRNHSLVLFDPKESPLSSDTTPGQIEPGTQ